MKLERKENEDDIYLMLNKPAGYVCARSDDNDKTIFEIIDDDIKNNYTIFPVGRLDKDTEGLLLLTNDGKFCHNVIHSKKSVEKVYEFWALGNLSYEYINKVSKGIYLEDKYADNIKPTKPAKLEVIETFKFSEIKDKIANLPYRKIRTQRDDQPIFRGRITIYEGRKHEVKRILKYCKCFVIYLKRLSIGNLVLDNNLKLGEIRKLTKNEVTCLNENKGKN